jgi:hypothetical protein
MTMANTHALDACMLPIVYVYDTNVKYIIAEKRVIARDNVM